MALDRKSRSADFSWADDVLTYNHNPRVFTWNATADSIMNNIAKCKEALDALH